MESFELQITPYRYVQILNIPFMHILPKFDIFSWLSNLHTLLKSDRVSNRTRWRFWTTRLVLTKNHRAHRIHCIIRISRHCIQEIPILLLTLRLFGLLNILKCCFTLTNLLFECLLRFIQFLHEHQLLFLLVLKRDQFSVKVFIGIGASQLCIEQICKILNETEVRKMF